MYTCHIIRVSDRQPKLTRTLTGSTPVAGVTSLNDQLFVVHSPPSETIEVYDSATFALQRNIPVPSLQSGQGGLTSCAVNNCLYAANWDANMIHRVQLPGDVITSWGVGLSPSGLSINKDNNVLVAHYGDNTIGEYTTQGSQVRSISLQAAGITNPMHVTQLTSGHYAVSAYGGARMSIVDVNEQIVHHYGGSDQLSNPAGLLSVKSGCILVANQSANNLVLVNPSLSVSRLFTPPGGVTVQGPYAMCYDESRGRLVVGNWNGMNVHVFDDLFDIGSDLK